MDEVYKNGKNAPIKEDLPLRPSISSAGKAILLQLITTILWIPFSLACVPLYIPGLVVWGKPPTIPSCSTICRNLLAAWLEGKPEENIPFTNRIIIFLIFLDVIVKMPVNGVCWYLDEVLYPSYSKSEIKDPLFIITATRSASTQITKYLEEDKENFVAPTTIEAGFPYIWAWRLVIPSIKKLGLHGIVEKELSRVIGKEAKKRTVFNIYKSDAWDGVLSSSHKTWLISQNLGCRFYKYGFVTCTLKEMDEDFCKCFIKGSDCILKKVVYHRGLPKQRVLIKGHFLFAAKTFEQHYKGAKFLALIRDPLERFQSTLNHFKVASVDGFTSSVHGLFPCTWKVQRDWLIETQICYCEEEMSFYKHHKHSQENTTNKLAISFANYITNLTSSLQDIYSFLNIPIPAEMLSKAAKLQSTTHDYTEKRNSYDPKYNRSLSSVGIDEEKLRHLLAEYTEWKNELDKKSRAV